MHVTLQYPGELAGDYIHTQQKYFVTAWGCKYIEIYNKYLCSSKSLRRVVDRKQDIDKWWPKRQHVQFTNTLNLLFLCLLLLYSVQHWRSTATCAAALGLPKLWTGTECGSTTASNLNRWYMENAVSFVLPMQMYGHCCYVLLNNTSTQRTSLQVLFVQHIICGYKHTMILATL